MDLVIPIVVYFFINYDRHKAHNRSIYCTHHLPAKKKILPAPCPICKRQNGTVQLVVFPQAQSKLVCRIGHYIAEEYNPSEDKRKHLKIDILDIEKRNSTTRGKIWHSFKIEPKGYATGMKEFQEYLELMTDEQVISINKLTQTEVKKRNAEKTKLKKASQLQALSARCKLKSAA